MAMLVSPERANEHLRADIDLDDSPPSPQLSDLLMKVEQASEIVLNYLKHDGTSFSEESPQVPWDADTVPFSVLAAVLLVLGALWRDREDGADGRGRGELLAPDGAVARLLVRYRDPALA
jgi:hypothetical protein